MGSDDYLFPGAPVAGQRLADGSKSRRIVGFFDRRVTSANVEIVFSNKLSWVNLIQFDNESNDLGIDSRFHWVPESGRNFYVVLSHNLHRNEIDDRFNTTQTGLTVKVDHTFRF